MLQHLFTHLPLQPVHTVFTDHMYYFPQTPEELFNAAAKVADRYGISGCVGFTDGTYIPMMTPIVNEKAFFCRKHYHALNVLVSSKLCTCLK